MNKTIIDFLNSLDVDIEKVNSFDGAKIKRDFDINPILSRFVMYKKNKEEKKVSINDVVGYDYRFSNHDAIILNNLSDYFDRDGDGYHNRSVSMLDIPQGQIMSELSKSFKIEPICLVEVDKAVYNIGSNGLHRYHVIKTHFLNELSKINPEDKVAIKRLKEKYSFEARISEIDYVKSYSAYLLNLLDDNLKLEHHYNSDYEMTEKSRLTSYLNPELEMVLTDEQLIEIVNKQMNRFLNNASRKERKEFTEKLKNTLKFESFKDYYENSLNQNQKGEPEWS